MTHTHMEPSSENEPGQTVRGLPQVVNADETNPQPIDVPFRDYVPYTVLENGQEVTRNRLVTRIAHIESFVPQELFVATLSIMDNFEDWQELLAGRGQQQKRDPKEVAAILGQMSGFVFKVWQLTEPEMTEQKFNRGLDFQRITDLFARFFAVKTPPSGNKA